MVTMRRDTTSRILLEPCSFLSVRGARGATRPTFSDCAAECVLERLHDLVIIADFVGGERLADGGEAETILPELIGGAVVVTRADK
jgi:hypothetical protein